jgi:hypothetical protein
VSALSTCSVSEIAADGDGVGRPPLNPAAGSPAARGR